MILLDKDGKPAKGTDIDNTQNMLRHWLSQRSVVNLLGRLKLLPPGDALTRLGNKSMDPGEAARIFRTIILNKKARRFIVQLVSNKLQAGERSRDIDLDLRDMAEQMKPLATASKSGLIIPS